MAPASADTTPLPESPFVDQLRSLAKASSTLEAKSLADAFVQSVKKFSSDPVAETLLQARVPDIIEWWAGSKSQAERESAGILVERLVKGLGEGCEGLFLSAIPVLLNVVMDKTQSIRSAAQSGVNAIIKVSAPEGTRQIIDLLKQVLDDTKGWRTKVGALKAMEGLVKPGAEEWVAEELGHVIPSVEHAMHDTKAEVSTAAGKCATTLCSILPNADIIKHIKPLVDAMASPAAVPKTIKTLSNTTFVAEVNAPTLAVMVPLLMRALKERSTDTQRMTCIVVGNLVKLVREKDVAARYLSPLVPGVENIATTAAFPEIRAFATSALEILNNAGASKDSVVPPMRDVEASVNSVLNIMLPHLPLGHAFPDKPSLPLNKDLPNAIELASHLEYLGGMIADLVDARKWDEAVWAGRALGSPLGLWIEGGKQRGADIARQVRKVFMDIDMAKYAPAVNDDDEEGELLCDLQFSLAYGGLLLLNHTLLRLRRGKRYGICAGNGQGKSTLMKAIRDGKVEGFPPQDQLRTLMVEHALQGEDASLPIIDFIASSKDLTHVTRERVVEALLSVGFSEEKQSHPVGSLSGGWKMKLELARAMLIGADILLLDEPTNHLDVQSVAWLEQWLCNQPHVTCLIVSHDSGFLDNVCTDIIHYESKKLVYYKGNLSKFVEKVPEAKSYYTLAATSIKFSFPPPGSLMGVRSNTRAIMKLTNCTFQYPGAPRPSLYNVSCALSLSSRVGILGPNGAGKSTLIKLLTGETTPQEGKVDKHPALRVGYVAQHAFHHLDQHLEKTPVAYIQWRYQDGHDREMLERGTRKLTEEEERIMDTDIVGKNGDKRKLEMIMGRQKLKKSFQYEVKFKGFDHRHNAWIGREELLKLGFGKLLGQFDDMESSREGAGTRDNAAHLIRKHLEDVGLDGDIAQYNEIQGLSGGQKVKVVIAAALWNNPQVLILDEPTNFLDREALGGLSVAIREWAGAVCIISHNMEFVNALCPEIWHVDAGRLTHKGKIALVEDAFDDVKTSRTNSRIGTPRTRAGTPTTAATSAAASAATSAATSEVEGGDVSKPKIKKKKLTRNEVKAAEARRAKRKLDWLTYGGEREPDTDDE
ncbi:[NU+] prion formation protein 1 [Naganishia albida]|nr:[NU+] prion formation protein 1 [Naganishia albida]